MIRIFYFFLVGLLIPEFLSAQKLTAEVRVVRDKLQGRNLDLFEGLEQRVTSYVHGYDWAKNEDPTVLNIDIQIYLEKVSEAGENKRVSATIFFSNGKELLFLDKEAVFNLKKGESFYHDENTIHPFLSLINFYCYITLGDELDAVGKLAGTPFFQKAKNIAIQAKAIVLENSVGWESRLIKVDEFLDQRYQEYRIMKDFYYEGLSDFENKEVELARENVKKAIAILERIITKNLTSYHSERFLQVHYLEICRIFENSNDTKLFDRLIALDPKNKDTYLKFRDQR